MSHQVEITTIAERDLKKLPREIASRVMDRLYLLASEPFPQDAKKLHDSAFYRVRVGNYRIIYERPDSQKAIVIIRVKHRRDAYRNLS